MNLRGLIHIALLAVLLPAGVSCGKAVTDGGGDAQGGGGSGDTGQETVDHETAHLTVGSYNVWNINMRNSYYNDRNDPKAKWYFDGDGAFVDNDPRLWENSRTHVGKAIVQCGYDVFALTEIDEPQMVSDICKVVYDEGGSYSWIFLPLNGVNADDGYDVIAYDPEVFDKLGTGTRWLSDIGGGKTPTIYGISSSPNRLKWEENKHRTFSYAFLRHKLTGKTIMFCTCHGPLNDEWNTYAGANYIKKYVDEINTGGFPVIFAGDLNSCPRAKEYGNGGMYGELKKFWLHAYDEAGSRRLLSNDERQNPCTWEGQRGQKSMLASADHPFKHQIDHIFYSSEFIIKGYWANRYTHREKYGPGGYRNFFPSDHIPIVAKLDL